MTRAAERKGSDGIARALCVTESDKNLPLHSPHTTISRTLTVTVIVIHVGLWAVRGFVHVACGEGRLAATWMGAVPGGGRCGCEASAITCSAGAAKRAEREERSVARSMTLPL